MANIINSEIKDIHKEIRSLYNENSKISKAIAKQYPLIPLPLSTNFHGYELTTETIKLMHHKNNNLETIKEKKEELRILYNKQKELIN